MINISTTTWFDANLNLDSLAELMKSIKPLPPRPKFVLTEQQAARLRKISAGESGFGFPLADVYVDKPLLGSRVRTGKIIQKDRFVEYDAADMAWAEPLGLAEWETVDRESVVFAIQDRLMESLERQFMKGAMPIGLLGGEPDFSSHSSDEIKFRMRR